VSDGGGDADLDSTLRLGVGGIGDELVMCDGRGVISD